MHSVGFNRPAPAAPKDESTKIFCDDEVVVFNVKGKKFSTAVGNLRKYPDSKLASMFPEVPIKVPTGGEFVIDRNPEVFGALLDVLSTDKLSLSSSISEAILQDEFNYWNLGAIEDLDLIEGDDDDDDDDEGIGSGGGGSGDHTDSESPQRSHHVSIPSNVRIPIISNSSNSSNCSSRDRLDTRYSMHADEMFGRAIALVRQEDLIVKVGDIQHGLALLRELLSMERSNVSYMFYLAYGEMRLGRTTEACYWCDRVLKLDPTNLAAASLRTLINDRRKQNSVTGLIVVGGIAVAAAVAWFVSRAASAPASNN